MLGWESIPLEGELGCERSESEELVPLFFLLMLQESNSIQENNSIQGSLMVTGMGGAVAKHPPLPAGTAVKHLAMEPPPALRDWIFSW